MPFIFSSSTEGTRTRTPTIMGTSPPPFAPPHSSLVSSSSLVALVLLSFRRATPTLLNSLPWGSSPMIFDNHISLSFSLFIHRFYQIWSTILWTLIYSCRREKTRVVFKCHVCPCSTLASWELINTDWNDVQGVPWLEVIPRVKTRRRERIKFFHRGLRFRENRVWRLINSYWSLANFTVDGGANNQREDIPRAEASNKRGVKFFRSRRRFRGNKLWTSFVKN